MKLHLGCGRVFIPEWTHVDVTPHPHVDIIADVGNLSMLRTGSVSMIYASHVLEHFPTERLPAVLAEWRRLLRSGGMLRISVPDFGVLSSLYFDGKVSLPVIAGPILGGQKDDHDMHLSIFDWETMHSFLTLARFVDIGRFDPEQHSTVDDFSKAKLAGKLISLNVQATRP